MQVKSNYKITYLPEAQEEYKSLEGNALTFVNKGLTRIKAFGMQAGQPLHGKLINCRKLKNKKLGLRIVFRQDKNCIRIINIVAIGKRRRNKVYKEAEQRLEKD